MKYGEVIEDRLQKIIDENWKDNEHYSEVNDEIHINPIQLLEDMFGEDLTRKIIELVLKER